MTEFDPKSLFSGGTVGAWYDHDKVRHLRDGTVAVTNLATFNRRRKFKVWLWNVFGKDAVFTDDLTTGKG